MDENQLNQGFLYIATGIKHIKEAIQSAHSLKKVNPQARITLVTSEEVQDSCFEKVIFEPFKTKIQRIAFIYKAKNMYHASPYEKTLFVDSDTYFYDDCSDLFELLDYCDLALSIETFSPPIDIDKPQINGKKLVGCQIYNTGVIAYNKNSKNQQLFDKWEAIYTEKITNNTIGLENDQTSFAEAWLQSDAKLAIFPREWNARTPFFITLNESVRLVHGRHENYEQLKVKLETPNAYKHRMWHPYKKKCITILPLKDIIPFGKEIKAIIERLVKK